MVQAGSSSVSDTLKKPAAVAVTKKGTFVYRQQFAGMSEIWFSFLRATLGKEANNNGSFL